MLEVLQVFYLQLHYVHLVYLCAFLLFLVSSYLIIDLIFVPYKGSTGWVFWDLLFLIVRELDFVKFTGFCNCPKCSSSI